VIPAFAKLFETNKVQLPLLTRVLVRYRMRFLAYWPVGCRWDRVRDIRFLSPDRNRARAPCMGSRETAHTDHRRESFSRRRWRASRGVFPSPRAREYRSCRASRSVAAVVDNAYLSRRIEQMREGVERGESVLRTAVTTGGLHADRLADDRRRRGNRRTRRSTRAKWPTCTSRKWDYGRQESQRGASSRSSPFSSGFWCLSSPWACSCRSGKWAA